MVKRGIWDWIRGGVIAFALLGHGVYALPNPASLKRADLRSPEGKEEMDRWRALLGTLGVEVTAVELEDFTLNWTGQVNGWHRSMKKPFRPFFRATRTNQSWALFASPDTHPHRLEVFAHIGGEWERVYRRNDPEDDFMDRTFRFRRVRGIYDSSSRKAGVTYWNFTRWASRRVLEAYPEADRVRVQMRRTHTTLPWEEPDTQTRSRVRREHTRTALFPTDDLIP